MATPRTKRVAKRAHAPILFEPLEGRALLSGGTISGVAFNDLNSNGAQGAGEPGVADVTVFLDIDNSGGLNAGDTSTTTDGNGNYTFTDLTPGDYTVRQVAPANTTPTAPQYSVLLTTGNQVGTVNGDHTGYGFGALSLNAAQTQLTIDIAFASLTSATNGIHIHRGAAGANGSIIYDFVNLLGLSNGFPSPVTGTVAFSPSDVTDLNSLNMYVNIHTTTNGSGEVRGQIVQQNAYTIHIAGTETVSGRDFANADVPAGEPEIDVSGNDIDISNADATPASGDGTDFGTTVVGATKIQHTFKVENSGAVDLTLSAPALPDGFILDEGLDATIGPGQSDTFTVGLPTTAQGAFAGDISITNNSSDSPYTFAIAGTVDPAIRVAITSIAVPRDATILVPGDSVTMTVQLTAVGADVSGEGTLDLLLVPQGQEDGTVVASKTGSISLKPGGKPVTLKIKLPVTAGVDPGLWNLQARATLPDQVASDITDTPFDIEYMAGEVGGRKNVKLQLTDGDGTPVTIMLPGGGTATLSSDDSPILTVDGADATRTLTISTKKSKTGGDDRATVGGVVVNSALKTLTAAKIDVDGDVTFHSTVAAVTLGDIAEGHDLAIEGTTGQASLTLGALSGVRVISAMAFKQATVIEWLDGAGSGSLAAPGLEKLTVKGDKTRAKIGDLEADITLSDPALTLKSLTVPGAFRGTLRTAGNLGTLTFGQLDTANIYAGLAVAPAGALPTAGELLNTTGQIAGVTVKGIKNVADGFIASVIAADFIKSVVVKDVVLTDGVAEFGVEAHKIKSYQRKTTGAPTFSLPTRLVKLDNTIGTIDDADTPGDDFVVRIV
ncbi:MAG: CHRD domain-containing protein [Planctomycetes bacterium]|nr:CHRD domain-containing protein [Planctomycetota bacterium]